MVGLTASGDADQLEARLREALGTHGLQLFARIDHATGARKADVELEPNVLLIFGKTSVGTPLMQADPHVGIELPLRMLIWQDPNGGTVSPIRSARPEPWSDDARRGGQAPATPLPRRSTPLRRASHQRTTSRSRGNTGAL